MFKEITVSEFNTFFSNESDCQQYLFDLKLKGGYRCRKCNYPKSVQSKTSFHLRCANCGYDESVTAHTLFHKVKIPLLKAFRIAFRIMVRKKGMSTANWPKDLE